MLSSLFTLVVAIASSGLTPLPHMADTDRRVRVRVEVSPKIAGLFLIRDGKVLLKSGEELTLLRGCDVELAAIPFKPFHLDGTPPTVRPPIDLLLQIQHTGDLPAMLANFPLLVTKDGIKKGGIHMPHSSFTYRALFPDAFAAGGAVEGRTNCEKPPTDAEWEKARLNGLAQIDAPLRKQLSEQLVRSARLVLKEKPGHYVDNPYSFAVSGKAEVRKDGKVILVVPFRVEPRSAPLWIDVERFEVRELMLEGRR